MPAISPNGAALPRPGGRGPTPTRRCRRADEAAPLAAEDLELLATSAYMLGRDDEYVGALERAHHALPGRAASWPRAARCALLDRHQPRSCAARRARATGLARPRPAAARPRGRRLRRARLPAAAADVRARGGRRPRRRDRRRRRGDRDRRALRRRRPARPRRAGPGHPADPAGARRRGAAAAGRGDGGGHGRRAVADRQRVRVLRRDHGLPGGVRAAPRAGVDRGAHALVRAAARHGELHAARAWCTAPRSCSCTARGPTPCRRRGGPASAARWRRTRRRPPRPSTGGARSIACAASSPRPRRPTARRAPAGASRSPAWRCCGWPRGTPSAAAAAMRRLRRRDDRAVPACGACCPPTSRSCWRSATCRAARQGLHGARGARPRGWEGGMLPALVAHSRGAVDLAEGDARAALVALRQADAGVAGARGAVRGRAGAACWSAWPAPRSATTTPPRSSSTPPARPSRGWARRRTRPASTRCSPERRPRPRTG